MVSKSKLYKQHDLLESELAARLTSHLEEAATGSNEFVFCVTEFNPHPELSSQTDATTEELIGLSRKILTLKKKLGEPSDGTAAERICWYCNEWGHHSNRYRKTGQDLAKQFLAELRAND